MDFSSFFNDKQSPFIECVINFSEGRDRGLIYSIEDTLKPHKEVFHLNTDIGEDANRTVITFAGPPQAVCAAAFDAIQRATLLIDMSRQQGEHPRIGAADVVPLVPLRGISLKETALWAKELGERIAKELDIPVFLYAAAATSPERESLPFIRRGGYEGIQKRIDEGFKPDFGPEKMPDHTGATAVGARELMLAYNINLKSNNVEAANHIASRVRSSGYMENGNRVPGSLKGVQAIGWEMPHYGCAQITANIHEINSTSMADLYEAVKKEAELIGEEVNGSELIGVAPVSALMDAGDYYIKKEGAPATPPSPDELIALAVEKLGLESVRPFDPELRIIEKLLMGMVV